MPGPVSCAGAHATYLGPCTRRGLIMDLAFCICQHPDGSIAGRGHSASVLSFSAAPHCLTDCLVSMNQYCSV